MKALAGIDTADTNTIKKRNGKLSRSFEKVSNTVTRAAGRPATSIASMILIVIWASSGPFFGFSETWQLIINTSTTIITFLMVFVIQTSANKDTLAVQLKLNELIAANRHASNRLIDVEDLTADELELLKKFYVKLSKLAEKEKTIFTSHSIDEAEKVHTSKLKSEKPKHEHRNNGKPRRSNGSNRPKPTERRQPGA
ncbi:MAG TPA: low affinity iron permease family protein [Cyclobacteriaceae bacterium]|nr:low affinity iron permease family protein [Cyclobacteriaceae bacterium]